MNSEEISKKILYQRIRNRIIEVLEITADPSQHEKFGGDEIICMWEDWVDDQKLPEYVEPVFSQEEQTAISEYHKIWNEVADNTPHLMPSVNELVKNAYWQKLIKQAEKALTVFSIKGRYSEEVEIT
ncbi:MAG: hypothetical protein OEY00_11085 [Gammaproteobacteria bacterium]|nr:hypothetical protein [Gammaproteobacteria bacterium]